jgi:hypothetical protein
LVALLTFWLFLQVSSNGLATFTAAAVNVPGFNEELPSENLPPLTIAAFWDEATFFPPAILPFPNSNTIFTRVFGQAPRRQFWIKWSLVSLAAESAAVFYLVLEEGTNKIFVVEGSAKSGYYPLSPVQLSATVGLQKDSETAVFVGSHLPIRAKNALPVDLANTADNSFFEFIPTGS